MTLKVPQVIGWKGTGRDIRPVFAVPGPLHPKPAPCVPVPEAEEK